jgi:hypothetical protein
MFGCEILFDEADAELVMGLMEEGLGKPCPCKRGLRCPLLPKTLAVVSREAQAAMA